MLTIKLIRQYDIQCDRFPMFHEGVMVPRYWRQQFCEPFDHDHSYPEEPNLTWRRVRYNINVDEFDRLCKNGHFVRGARITEPCRFCETEEAMGRGNRVRSGRERLGE